MEDRDGTKVAVALLTFAIIAWVVTWILTKSVVAHVPALWIAAIRAAIACFALAIILVARRAFVVPRRGDIPVVLVTAVFHMIAFSALISLGLKYIPLGRSIVLGYTTPLWVAPAAWLTLGEPVSSSRILGVALGFAGVLSLFNPFAFDWSDRQALLGSGLLVTASLAWAVSILYVRAHRWISSPFQLSFWQALVSTVVLIPLAVWFEGVPRVDWNVCLAGQLGYLGLVGTGLAFCAMNEANRRLSATATALGVLATPILGIIGAAIFLDEQVDASLVTGALLIVAGIGIGAIPRGGRRPSATRQNDPAFVPASP